MLCSLKSIRRGSVSVRLPRILYRHRTALDAHCVNSFGRRHYAVEADIKKSAGGTPADTLSCRLTWLLLHLEEADYTIL